MVTRRMSRAAWLAIVLLVAWSVAGCSKAAQPTPPESKPQEAATTKTQEAPQPSPAKEAKKISIAGGPMGGSYYPISVGISEVISKYVEGVQVDVPTTAGAIENATFIGTGEADLGLTNGDVAYEAYNGTGRYEGKKLSDLRLLFAGVAGGRLHVAVSAKSPIKSYKDLKGKHVAMGPKGSTGPYIMSLLLEFYGLKMDDVKASYLPFDEGVRALTDGNVDAAVVVAPVPAPAIRELAATKTFSFRLLQVEDEIRDKFTQKYPFFVKADIPADTYQTGEVIKTLSSTNIAVVNAKLSDDLVYKITKAIFEHLDVVRNAHPSAKTLSLEQAPAKIIPIHPGAERYYREQGVLK